MEQLSHHLKELNAKYPTDELQKHLNDGLKNISLLDEKVNTSSLDGAIIALKGMRIGGDKTEKIDAALNPLQIVQQALLDPVLTYLLDNYQNQK